MTKRAEKISKYLERLAILEKTNSDKYDELYREFRNYLKTTDN